MNVAERVDGDLVATVYRAREIDRRLAEFKTSGRAGRNVGNAGLVAAFLADVGGRADAGGVKPASVARYCPALAHYLAAFTSEPATRSASRT